MTREIDTLVGEGAVDDWDFEAIESAARRRALHVAAGAVQTRLNADTSDQPGPRVACACGPPARYAGRRTKTFASVLGPLTLARAYYHCAACDAGFCPRDRALGLLHTSRSPGVRRMVGRGRWSASRRATTCCTSWPTFASRRRTSSGRPRRSAGRSPPTSARWSSRRRRASRWRPPCIVAWTGPGSRSARRPGPADPATSRTAPRRPAKSSSARSGAPRDATRTARPCATPGRSGIPRRSSAPPVTTPTPCRPRSPSAWTARPAAGASARRLAAWYSARPPWIWNLAEELFPGAIQIVDRFHAKQHLSDVSKAIYGATSDLAPPWASQRHDELDDGDLEAVLTALRTHAPSDDEARKCVDYVTTHRARMRDAEFRALGLCTSTGVGEAGYKTAIGVRCKRAGMHWSVAGADAIIALRCGLLRGRFEDFWGRRAQQQAAA